MGNKSSRKKAAAAALRVQEKDGRRPVRKPPTPKDRRKEPGSKLNQTRGAMRVADDDDEGGKRRSPKSRSKSPHRYQKDIEEASSDEDVEALYKSKSTKSKREVNRFEEERKATHSIDSDKEEEEDYSPSSSRRKDRKEHRSRSKSPSSKRRVNEDDSDDSEGASDNKAIKPHPLALAFAGIKKVDENSEDDEQEKKPAPMSAILKGVKEQRPASGGSAGGSGDHGAVHPFAAALQAAKKEDGPPVLRPVFSAGAFEAAKLKKTNTMASTKSSGSSISMTLEDENNGMDSVRQAAIRDARHCSQEATEIYPFLRVSGDKVARNKELLQESGVTHILNLAGSVCKNYHEDSKEFEYLKLNIIDSASESITPFLLEAIAFIEKARKKKGCCFVHCHMGVSRSCTAVIAYMMLRDKKTFQDAHDHVKKKRPVCSPNAGFIGQLQQWEKTLTVMPKSPQLYRMAPHSKSDADLVCKLCTKDDYKTPVPARPDELDARGFFLVHDPSNRKLFVWEGPRCKDKTVYRRQTKRFSQWMVDLLPAFRKHEIVKLSNAPSQVPFWVALGVNEDDAKEFSDADVDQDLEKYNSEYSVPLKVIAAPPSPLSPKKAKQLSPSSNASSRTGRKRKNAPFKVLLYSWHDEQDSDEDTAGQDPAHEWRRCREYDSDDLISDSMFVLLVHDRVQAKKAEQNRKTIHKAFIWIGSNLEGRLNEQAGTAKATAFVKFCQERTSSPPIKSSVEHESKETELFWEAFECGF